MLSSGIQHLIQLLSIILLLNVVFAVYEPPNVRRNPFLLNNQRSADGSYKYAWFTRDIHDDVMNGEENILQDEQLSPQKLFRMKMLKNSFNQKYLNDDQISLESNEKL
jgi:hypothetical protein